MFCQNCGAVIPDDSAFCAECGAKTADFAQSVPFFSADTVEETISEETGKKSVKKVSGKKNPVKIIIALVLAAALVVCGIIFVPGLLKGGKINVKENAFAAKAKEVGKNDDSYETLNLLAYVHNTLFNSKSFTFSGPEDSKGKIVFGKDLASTEFYFSMDDGYVKAAMFDGTFLASNSYDAVKVDVGSVVGDVDDIADALVEDYMSHYSFDSIPEETQASEYIQKEMDSIKDLILSAVKNKKLNHEILNIFLQMYKTSMDDVVEFAASLSSDDLSVKKSKDSGTTVYSVKCNLADLAEKLLDFVDSKGILNSMYGENADSLYNEFAEEVEYLQRYHDDYDISVKAELDGNYISSVKLTVDGETLKVSISDVNSTKITKDDYKKVEKYADDAEVLEIEDGEDAARALCE